MADDAWDVGSHRLLLHAIVARHARERPNATALRCGDRTTSYSELHRIAERTEQRLREAGLVPGERIVFIGRNSDSVPILALAANRMGAVPVPLNWRLASAEMAELIADAEARLVIFEPDFAQQVLEIRSRARSRFMDVEATAIRSGEALPDLAGDAPLVPDPGHACGAVAVQIYTSGTTGRPKGVLLSHRSLNGINALRHLVDWDGWTSEDVTLVSAPLGHIGAYGMMVRSLFFGGVAVIQPTFDAGETLDAIERFRISKIALVPTAIRMVLDHPRARVVDYRHIDTIIYGASPITPALLQEAMAVFGCRFAQSYGMSETSGPVVALPPDDHDVGGTPRMAAAGRPLPGTEVRIATPEGSNLPTYAIGEICIRSVANMVGYWRLPEQTAETLSTDNWLRTGDLGHVDDDGYVYVRSRVKEMIISGAENIYPAEVENAIASHPDVGEVAVIGVPDPHWGEAVHAFVAPVAGRSVVADGVQAWARARIAGYKVPKRVEVLDILPHNANGKIDKLALKAMAQPRASTL